jgi:hypothetical protein
LIGAVRAGFYWGETADNCEAIVGAAFGKEMISPGALAALRGYWRGKNRHEREEIKKIKSRNPRSGNSDAELDQKRRERYKGQG